MAALRIRKRAQAEITEAFEWDRARSPEAAAEFLEALDAAVFAIQEAPERHHVVSGRLRRVLLQGFPYGVYYKPYPSVISVVGVIHGHRHPNTWLARAAP
jgi:plasmid stabilization system protein ParE